MINTQEEALSALHEGTSLHLGGIAGSGKSWTINKFVEEADRNILVTASTGIAARNIEGTTVHHAFGLGLGPRETDDPIDFANRAMSTDYFIDHLEEGLSKIDTLVIDEISMLSNYVLVAVDHILKDIKRDKRPFGGVQLVFSGDFLQLAPVTKDEDRAWVFFSPLWQQCQLENCYLLKSFRQKNEDFVNILNQIRVGAVLPDTAKKLAAQVIGDNIPDDAVQIMTHNDTVDKVNMEKLQKLDVATEETFWSSEKYEVEEEIKALRSQVIAPRCLTLRVGAKVMFLRNTENYYNGDTGIVTGYDKINNRITVVKSCSLETVHVERKTWDNSDYRSTERLQASITQFPLKLAWACSAHKSQGMSFDKTYVDISRCFASGQTYTMISRVRTIEGLNLKLWSMSKNKVSKVALDFYRSIGVPI